MKKKILLIAPTFFNYYAQITKALEAEGWVVSYIPDRPPVGTFGKIGIRKFRFFFESWLDRFYLDKLANLGRFEHILIIKGECITPRLMTYLRREHAAGPISFYLWDSLKNSPGARKLIAEADHASTFDPNDANEMGTKLVPLFYSASEKRADIEIHKKKYKLSFVGSVHGDRLKVIAKVRRASFEKADIFIFAYFPSKILFYFRKIWDPSFGDFKSEELSLTPISKKEVEAILGASMAVLDIHHPSQSGLTMRTIESLALGLKLVTTNETIKNYTFYDPKVICIIDREKPVIPDNFFENYDENEIRERMQDFEIKKWISKVLSK